MSQTTLFGINQSLRSTVISRRRDFEALFDGFFKLTAISYVVSPDLLLEFFEKRGYKEVEVLVGENLSEQYRKELSRKQREVTERLSERVDAGSLRILVPKRTVHSKLYILEGIGPTRVIVSSANLTEAARQASNQTNYAWYTDLPSDHPWLSQILSDYQAHSKGCTLFMDDLVKLFRTNPEDTKADLIDAWLRGVVSDDAYAETSRALQEISLRSLQHSRTTEESIFTIELGDIPGAKKQIEKMLAPLNPVTSELDMRISGPDFIRYVEESHGFPIMRVDAKRQEVLLGINGSTHSLTEPLPDPAQANAALAKIEAYLETVEQAESPDHKLAKMNMYEALLYVMFAPFATDYMANRRERYRLVDQRGPRFLYIYGPSQNGKSTFLRFALRLLTGHHIGPFNGSAFNKTRVQGAASIGTVFPLVFDDVVPSQNRGFEDVLKSYWEVWWKNGSVSPQIILSSNSEGLKEWAKSRVKRVDFDVHFAPTEQSKEKLAQFFALDNAIFRWFSFLYFQQMQSVDSLSDDELHLARAVMRHLYQHANRPLPPYFPSAPIEKLDDPGRKRWHDLVYRLRQATIRRERDRALVKFDEDMQYREIREYEAYLPQTVKFRRQGKTLVIESPKPFYLWLDEEKPSQRNFLARAANWFNK